ncbi:hypothetical protein AB833_28700 [Chromatiales bacterium (ex Bugula neritina AB1)]|nr:hypothetical protein AB833_28700 [Chromatiales bacterium (ex Bugula neritina AB1)]
MSLVGTLAKVAMGAMVAKGVSGALKGGGAGGGGLGGLLGSMLGGQGGGGGLGDLLGGQQQRGGGGGLGGLLGGLAGGQQSGGGLGGALGQILGGQQGGQAGQQGGGLGGLLESLGGGAAGGGSGGLGDLLNSALAGNEPPPSPTAEKQAEVCLRAMLMAARADGEIDAAEQEKITGQLGDISQEEADFIRNEMTNPPDFNSFVAGIPQGMEQQVYLMSLLAIDLDSQAEAQYLDKLAKSTNIDNATSNAIHQKLGVPTLYS